jgi:hypothetical protein
LPWPLYLFHHEAGNVNSLHIHLSDGGQNENLGVYALLRRGVRDIVVADGAEDTRYDLGDLCELGKQLWGPDNNKPESVLEIEVKYNNGDPWSVRNCGKGKNPLSLKNNLPAMILRGRVCMRGEATCDDESAAARLYIIKAALNYDAISSTGRSLRLNMELARNKQLRFEDCSDGLKNYPCEVISYLASNGTNAFPQGSTVAVTLNTNAYIYGAYKELGRYYSSHLKLATGDTGAALEVTDKWTDIER